MPFSELEGAFFEIERRSEELKQKLSQALEMIDDELTVDARILGPRSSDCVQ